jgi:hypothetical protein
MRVLLKLELSCDPDAAWLAIRSPRVFRAVAAPLTSFESLEDGGFPEVWPDGEHRVRVTAIGGVPLGEQVVNVSVREVSTSSTGEARIFVDTGRGVSGVLSVVTFWEHSMAISPASGGHTLYRDQLKFQAGALTPLLWPVYWAYWQWRGYRLKVLSRGWVV